jgi:hypothetical protein
MRVLEMQSMEKPQINSEPKLLREFSVASVPGNEQEAMQWVDDVVCPRHSRKTEGLHRSPFTVS